MDSSIGAHLLEQRDLISANQVELSKTPHNGFLVGFVPEQTATAGMSKSLSPPLAPVTPCKDNCQPHEVMITSPLEGSEEKGSNGEGHSVASCSSNGLSKPTPALTPAMSKRSHECPSSSSSSSLCFTLQQEVIVPHTTDRSVDKETGKDGDRGRGTTNSTRQRIRKKHHRPKVVVEDKPAKTPKPKTPSQDGEVVKRKYVRKKKTKNSSGDSNTVDRKTSGSKSVRRRLNFDSEDGAMDETQSQVQEAGSTVELPHGIEVVVQNPEVGFAFDLNCSLDQVLKEYIRSPDSTRSLARPSTTTENQKKIDQKESNSNYHSNESLIDGMMENTRAKRDLSLSENTQTCYWGGDQSGSNFAQACKINQASKCHEMSSSYPSSPKIYRRRKLQKRQGPEFNADV